MKKNFLFWRPALRAAPLAALAAQSLLLVTFALFCASSFTAQAGDDTQLKQVIIFGRHGVRAPLAPPTTLDNFSAQPYPDFGVATSDLTANGATLETMLGAYYRLWLKQQGVLTGNDPADAAFVYFRVDQGALIVDSAKAFAAGMLPAVRVGLNTYPAQESDPVFDPIGAGVATLDQNLAVAAVMGRLGGNPQSLASAYAPELALARSVLFGYPLGTTPLPATPSGKVDVTAIPITVTAGQPGMPVGLGGLALIYYATDPFVMEYADGMSPANVGWGQLTEAGVSQTLRLDTLVLNLEFRTPYLDRVQSSNLASHVVRSMLQAATGNSMRGALGNPSTKVIVLVAGEANLTGLAGLFKLDWVLPGYQLDDCAPSGVLVFELRQSASTHEYFVRASYVGQTLDQLRNLTPLTLAAPPARAPVFIPGCSESNATFDCPLQKFQALAEQVIDPNSSSPGN
jgi:4-phytase/acid phosphatase